MLLFLLFIWDLMSISFVVSYYFGWSSSDGETIFTLLIAAIVIGGSIWLSVVSAKAKKRSRKVPFERPKPNDKPLSSEEMEKFQLKKRLFRHSYWLIVAIEIIIALLCIIARLLIGS